MLNSRQAIRQSKRGHDHRQLGALSGQGRPHRPLLPLPFCTAWGVLQWRQALPYKPKKARKAGDFATPTSMGTSMAQQPGEGKIPPCPASSKSKLSTTSPMVCATVAFGRWYFKECGQSRCKEAVASASLLPDLSLQAAVLGSSNVQKDRGQCGMCNVSQ